MRTTNIHHVQLNNIDLNVVLAALELLTKSRRHTQHTREWAADLYGSIKSLHWNFSHDAMKDVMPK